ncbi:MAG: S-layer homology domain-containing protein [Clostridia bacterium]|nr:S-layer homology domain-containing protein [Clostridia bacterium]
MTKKIWIIFSLIFILLMSFSVVFAAAAPSEDVSAERKSTFELTVPEEYRLEISKDAAIDWASSQTSVVNFCKINDFTATVTAIKAGNSTITFRQGTSPIYKFNVTVPDDETDIPNYTLYLGRSYKLPEAEELGGDYIYASVAAGAPFLQLSSKDCVKILTESNNWMNVQTIKKGSFTLYRKSAGGYIPALSTNTEGGHYIMSEKRYQYIDTLGNYTVVDEPEETIDPIKVSIERKAEQTVTVPEANRKTLNWNNRISWSSSDSNIATFSYIDNFDADIIGVAEGTATITCKQGSKEVFVVNVTVTDNSPEPTHYKMLLGRNYYLPGCRETQDTKLDMPRNAYGGRYYKLSDENCIQILDKDTSTYLVKATKEGTFTLYYSTASSQPSAPMTMSTDGSYKLPRQIINFFDAVGVYTVTTGITDDEVAKISMKRKDTESIAVSEENKLEITAQNAIRWSSSDKNIVDFSYISDLEAKITAKKEGSATVTCKQGDVTVYKADVTVTDDTSNVPNYVLRIDKKYYLPGASETEDTEISMPIMAYGGRYYQISDNNCIEVIQRDSKEILIKAIATGKFTLFYSTASNQPSAPMTMTTDGHVELPTQIINHLDPVGFYTVISTDDCIVTFDSNGGSGTMSQQIVKKGNTLKLPKCDFKAPSGMEFSGWDAGSVGSTITISDDMTVNATWVQKEDYTDTDTSYDDTQITATQVDPTPTIESEEQPPIEEYKPIEEIYTDVKTDDWYYDSVRNAVEKGWFSGTSSNTFSPNSKITRGMLVTVLYRNEEADEKEFANFSDVGKDSYYSKPIAWASKNKIVNGTGENTFLPDKNITRQDLITIVYRYVKAKYPENFYEYDQTVLDYYEDNNKISDYAKEAFSWAISCGVITGRDNGQLAPQGYATRAETAAILQRCIY